MFKKGIDAFNDQAYFDFHEILEPLWIESQNTDEKAFLQGLIQIGVAYYKLDQDANFIGARNKFKKGLTQLTPLKTRPPFCDWLDLATLLQHAQQDFDTLQRNGEAGFTPWDNTSFPQLKIKSRWQTSPAFYRFSMNETMWAYRRLAAASQSMFLKKASM